MALKQFTIDYPELSEDIFLRFDFDYFEIKKKLKLGKAEKLKKYLHYLETGKPIVPDDYSETITDNVHIVVRNIVDGKFDDHNVIYINDDKAEELEKYRISKGDIVIGISSNCGFSFYYDGSDNRNLTLSHYLARFSVNQKYINPIFLNYYINSAIIKQYFKSVETGKTLKNLSKYYIKQLPILITERTIQDAIVQKIEPIEKSIGVLKEKVLSNEIVINKVFANHFGFDIENADKKKRELVHYASLEDLANEELKFDISLKYRYIFLNYIKNPSNIEWIELGKLVDVKGGKRLPKGQNITEEETDYKYIRVDDLSWSGVFDLENIKYISEENHNAIKNYIAKENDILLTIVGATVGKCGLVPAELDGENITENFARLIIKDKENYLPEYVNYCLQSKTSVYQIDEYKGRGSQGKLALFRIKKIKMPKIGKTQQQEIVDEIKAELDKQELLKQQITTERNKIDKIIEECILTAQ